MTEPMARQTLAQARLYEAQDDLKAAKVLLEADLYRCANNSCYYAMFHAVSAVQYLDGNAYKRHKDAIANFNKEYIHTGIFPSTFGRMLSNASIIRHGSDYDPHYLVSKEDTKNFYSNALSFVTAVATYCKERMLP